jgi:catechol 2,3-dioxygenase-like lactoylglutathione lyase family enzyme
MRAWNRFTFVVATLLSAIPAFGQQKRPAITGIAYVRIYANDLASSEKFYAERLQLPGSPCAIGRDCRQFQVGKDQYVEVVKANDHANGMGVVAFRTSDAPALRTYLAAHKAKVPSTVQKHPDGSHEFQMSDPEGHPIAFLQPGKSGGRQGAISHRMIHIGFVVKDRAVMDEFYKGILGFRPYWFGGRTEGHRSWVSSQVPDGTDWMEYMLDVKPDADHHLLGVMNHFSLGVADINDAAAGLSKSGWKPNEQEHTQVGRDGKRQLNVWDPDEVRIEFMEFTPAQKPCCSEFTATHPTAD